MTRAGQLLSNFNESVSAVERSEKPISKAEQDKIVKDNFRAEYQDKWKNGTAKKFVNKNGHEFVAINSESGTHVFQKSSGSNGFFQITSSPESSSNLAKVVDDYTKEMDSDKQFK